MAEATSKTALAILEPEALWTKVRKDWLVSTVGCEKWFELVGDRRRQLEAFTPASPSEASAPLVLIAEADPAIFLAGLWAALLTQWNVALANPDWGSQEWQSASNLINPDIIWGEKAQQLNSCNPQTTKLSTPAILIPTGGSSGHIKFAHHTWTSLMTSVNGFRRYFAPGGEPINAFCVLPVYHVSGLMQALRAWASNGQMAITPFKKLEATPYLTPMQGWYISLVPTQLARLIRTKKGAWLSQFQTVFLGGAPPWASLLNRATKLNIPLCLSYGMTETAAMVTALKPDEFLKGVQSSGRSLPHATIQILGKGQVSREQASLTRLPKAGSHEVGQVVIHSAAIAQNTAQPNLLYTDDLGYLDAGGHLHITGRASSKIISGGENIFPAEIEAALRSTGQIQDVCILGWPDSQWGQIVVAAYVPTDAEVCVQSLKAAIATTLSRYKQPKQWISFTALPRNAQGKLNRQQLIEQLSQSIPTSDRSVEHGGESEC